MSIDDAGQSAASNAGGKSRQPTEMTGLCVTCVRRAECAYPRNTDQPVVFCEEFEPQVQAEVAAETRPETAVVTAEQMRTLGEYKGLCASCDNREVCTKRNSEVGVWHCEEYS